MIVVVIPVMAAVLWSSSVFAQSDPDYPLGRLGLPPVTAPADPMRLADLSLGVTRDGGTLARFETRVKLNAWAFFGAEVRGERLGAFFDTQPFEFGVTEEGGHVAIDGLWRSSRTLLRVDADKREDETWNLVGDGSVRLSPDWEFLIRYQHDNDTSRGGPPSLTEFIETSRLPPPDRPNRVARSGAMGFLYQRDNDLEVSSQVSLARIRTEAGFDQNRTRVEGYTVWNASRFEIDGRVWFQRVTGRAERNEGMAALGIRYRLSDHVVLSGGSRQEAQPGVELPFREYRAGITFFGRRFRFARRSAIADEVLRLTRRANERGLNERRSYGVDALRELRDRLSISRARSELMDAVNDLYVAQVTERNVPQLGVEVVTATDEVEGSDVLGLRGVLGVPWTIAWPFSTGADRVEFLRFEYSMHQASYSALGWTTRTHEMIASAELDRQHRIRVRWERPGQTPEEFALARRRETTVSVDYVYALGR